jgi:hypothetical protein
MEILSSLFNTYEELLLSVATTVGDIFGAVISNPISYAILVVVIWGLMFRVTRNGFERNKANKTGNSLAKIARRSRHGNEWKIKAFQRKLARSRKKTED